MSLKLLPLALLVAGCKTHLEIRWAASFDEAQRAAVASHKPILAVLAAGEIAGLC
jgi:hypothetical protein